VLAALQIKNLAIAEDVQVVFSKGLNVITGETGTGKSLIIDALSLLLGSKADVDLIRTGEAAARVEGIFEVDDHDDLLGLLREAGIEAEGQLVISRELRREGRGLVRVNGNAVVQAQLVAIGQRLVDVHGQGDYMSLLRPAEHITYLDRFAGTQGLRDEFAGLVGEIRRVREDIEGLTLGERERLRRVEQLQFEVDEIDGAQLSAGEEDELTEERTRLANSEQLVSLAQAVFESLEEGEISAVDATGRASEALSQLARIDPRLEEQAEALERLQDELSDISREMRSYRDEVEHNPVRLEQIEERLARLATLKRKYGSSLQEVLEYAEKARAELDTLSGGEERTEELRRREEELRGEVGRVGQELASRRREAGLKLATAVEAGLAELGMEGSQFAVRLSRQEAEDGVALSLSEEEVLGREPATAEAISPVRFEREGLEKVEFLATMNPGEDLRPLARVASGGETSRLMLVLKSIIGEADATPTLVFDEVDAGIGGRTALIVGRRLRELGVHHQVICISHLAQIAAFSNTHLSVTKEVVGERTVARVVELAPDERVVEMAQMIGGPSDASVAAARELIASAGSGRQE
jgi:DNA repair protein RecN (Recombination protein N)